MKKSNNLKKLNIGCGKDYREGFINIDIRKDVNSDLTHDISEPFPFSQNSTSEILANDIFEHLTNEQQISLFSELYRILINEGTLHVRIPNYDDILKRFAKDPDTRNLFLFGDTSESGIWGSHKSRNTLNSFIVSAIENGFKVVKCASVETNYEIEFVKSKIPILKGIVYINQTLSMGGAESFMTQLLVWFLNNKIPVKARSTLRRFSDDLKSRGIQTKKIPIVVDVIGNWKGLVKGIFLMPLAIVYYAYLTIIYRNCGTILLSGYIEKILVTPWANLFKVPVVWIEYGPLQAIFSKFFGLPKFLYRLVSTLPDFIIEPSNTTMMNNVNIAGISTGRTKIIPCGIYPPKPVKCDTQNLTVYCVSRMEKGKGQDLLINAWPAVLKRYPKAELYLIGEGVFQTELKKLTSKLNLNKSIFFLNWVNDLTKKISSLQLAVFPSVWPLEGFGMVLIEAMSLGKPIVCFDSGPYNEIVNSKCALLVKKGDTKELSDAIIKIFSSSQLAKKIGLNGKNRFTRLFTLDKIAKNYYKVLLQAQIRTESDKYK